MFYIGFSKNLIKINEDSNRIRLGYTFWSMFHHRSSGVCIGRNKIYTCICFCIYISTVIICNFFFTKYVTQKRYSVVYLSPLYIWSLSWPKSLECSRMQLGKSAPTMSSEQVLCSIQGSYPRIHIKWAINMYTIRMLNTYSILCSKSITWNNKQELITKLK